MQHDAVAAAAQQGSQLGGKEVIVFEQAQDGQVDDDVAPKGRLAPAAILYQQSAGIGTGRGEGDKQQKAPVPPAVEYIAGHYHQQVLPPQLFMEQPVECEDCWQEDEEF